MALSSSSYKIVGREYLRKVDSIFSRFVQLDDWGKGVGLGLAICKGLVGQMQGKIWATSKLGEGSVFFVSLPLIHLNNR